MKKVIEIKNITLGDLNQYVFSSYPEPGIYKNEKDTYNIYFVANAGVWSMPENQIISDPYIEQQQTGENISVETMLKTLAVAQKPELAIELAKVSK